MRKLILLAILTLPFASLAGGQAQPWSPPPPLKGPCPGTVDSNTAWFDPNLYPLHGNGVKVGRALNHPDPDYSETARKAKIMGNVSLALAINASGTVDDARIVCSLEPGLDANAAYAARQWKFTPATKDGQPVPVQIEVVVGFSSVLVQFRNAPGSLVSSDLSTALVRA